MVGCWRACLERDADLHIAQLMQLPLTVSCFSKIQIDFKFLIPAHPGSPRQRAVKRVCVCIMILDDDLVKAGDWECQQELNAEVVIVWCCHGRHPVQRVLLEQYMYTLQRIRDFRDNSAI